MIFIDLENAYDWVYIKIQIIKLIFNVFENMYESANTSMYQEFV